MSILSAALMTKLADFGAKVGISLYLKWHGGASHERAERYRKILKEMEQKKNEK